MKRLSPNDPNIVVIFALERAIDANEDEDILNSWLKALLSTTFIAEKIDNKWAPCFYRSQTLRNRLAGLGNLVKRRAIGRIVDVANFKAQFEKKSSDTDAASSNKKKKDALTLTAKRIYQGVEEEWSEQLAKLCQHTQSCLLKSPKHFKLINDTDTILDTESPFTAVGSTCTSHSHPTGTRSKKAKV